MRPDDGAWLEVTSLNDIAFTTCDVETEFVWRSRTIPGSLISGRLTAKCVMSVTLRRSRLRRIGEIRVQNAENSRNGRVTGLRRAPDGQFPAAGLVL
jgi:hypothetical protein